MKSQKFLASAIAIALGALISVQSIAQTTTTPSGTSTTVTKPAPVKTTTTTPTTPRTTTTTTTTPKTTTPKTTANSNATAGDKKEDFMNRYNEMKKKCDDFLAKTKGDTKHAELTSEVSKLDNQLIAFKAKLDKLDSTPKDKVDAFKAELKSDWKTIEAQHDKVKADWEKDHPGTQTKTNPPKSTSTNGVK